MHWYVGMLISRCAAIRQDMCRPEQAREMSHVNACAHLSLLKGMLEGYYGKGYNNGFADHSTGRYVLGMVIDDIQDAITTALEKAIQSCKVNIVGVDDELDADHLQRVILNRLSMFTYKVVCGDHIMCGNWLIDNITATKKTGTTGLCVEVKFCSGGHESFSSEFRHIDGMWVCIADLVEKYIADLSEMGCEVAQLDT